jgi:5-methylcytosine-specific restriction protein A
MAWHRRPEPGNWQTLRRQVLAAHNGVCHVCGHEGADQCDHLLNVARGGTHDVDNLAPIHGTPSGANPCPTCGRHCHQDKTKAEQAAGRAGSNRNRKRPTEQHPGRIA